MTIGIKATDSKGLRVINCTFSGLDTDIELDGVEDFTSLNNKFSQGSPQAILDELYKEILNSNLSEESKRTLFREAVHSLSNENNFHIIKEKLLTLIGNQALAYFVQLAAAVSAGLIIRRI